MNIRICLLYICICLVLCACQRIVPADASSSQEIEQSVLQEELTEADQLFELVEGSWEFSEYVGSAIEAHSYEDFEGQNIDAEPNIMSGELAGEKIEISRAQVEYFLPAGETESGYIVSSYENMFFGYKPPINMDIEYPVYRFYLKLEELDFPIYFIFDSEGKAVIDIRGEFYYAHKIL